MTHFYEKNIVEIKNEYTVFLCNIIAPLLYEGLRAMYENALEASQQLKKSNTQKGKTAGPLKIFQMYLKNIPNLTKTQVEKEAIRIKNCCRDRDFFDDLIKAVIKSNIVLLTFNASKNKSEIVNQKYHERIDTTDFIHKCYIECARSIYNNPELFWHKYSNIEINRNQRETCDIIKNSIKEAIRRMLPMKLILMDYLKNDYIEEKYDVAKSISEAQYTNMKNMVTKDLYGKEIMPNLTGGELKESMLEDNDGRYDNIKTEEDSEDEKESSNKDIENVEKRLLGEKIVDSKVSDINKFSEKRNDDITSEYTMSIQDKLMKVSNELEPVKETSLIAKDNTDDIFIKAENNDKKPSEKSEFFAHYLK